MCVKQRTISTTMNAVTVTTTTTEAPPPQPPQRAAAGETTASIVSNRDPLPQGGIVIKAGSSPSSPHSATLLSLPRVNLAPLLATSASAAAAGMPTAELNTQLRREHRENCAIFADSNNSGKEAEAFAAGGALALALVNESEDDQRDKTARAQDFEDASDRIEYDFDDDDEDSMGQCYPKCMNQYEDGGVILPGMRAKRSSKQRTNLSSMKNPAVTLDYDDDGDDDCGDFEAIGHAMGALDLEELASGNIVNALFDQPPKSIVVDYEEAHDVDQQQRRPRQNSVTDCARDACRPMDHAQNQVEELIFANDPKSTPLTPGRRRSRKDSIGNSNSNSSTINSSTSAATPRRGKSVILENTKVVAREPVSPLTDTDVSEADSDLRCSSVPKLCLCEVKLHKTKESCWLIANNEVFDVTGILDVHPGGPRSILRKAGGLDCTQDMKFHTKNARKMLDKCFIGKLQPCGDEPERQDSNCSIM